TRFSRDWSSDVCSSDLALSVAAQLPKRRFVMIGGPLPGTAAYYERIAAAAACVPNVRFLGALPHDEVNAYIARAKVLLNTSTVEGFPNTFLQAWARAVPVVSLFDPDGIDRKSTRLNSSHVKIS